jgi:hypothetical protein
MAQRSRPHGRDSSPAIALWKDPVRGIREIPLEAGAQGVLLTVCGGRASRRTADGRRPVDNVTHYFDVAVCQIRASSAGTESSNSWSGTPTPRVLEADELTILTGWAEALAEVLAYAPECVEALLADARAGVPWRAALRIPEPSQRLSEATGILGQAVRAAMSPSGVPTLDALNVWSREDRPGEHRLETLVRRVLRSTLEQLRTRPAKEP